MNKLIDPTIFIFFGPPGAGKGEQANRLSSALMIPHISSGNLLREECRKETSLGSHFNELLKKGHFPADEHIIELITNRINHEDCRAGFILDGFPRTLNQAKILDKHFKNTHSLYFVQITIDEHTLLERLLGRRICASCHHTYHIKFLPPKTEGFCNTCNVPLELRNDDNETVIKERFKIFNEKFASILQYYQQRDNWVVTQSKGNPQECFETLLNKLNEKINLFAATR